MIVADTNALAYLFLTGDHTPAAERVYQSDPVWAVPLLWRSEFRNVLAHYIRRGQLSLSEAQRIMDAASELVHGREFDVPSAPVLRLVAESTCSAYDCEFVALAQDLGVQLVTSDRQLLSQFPSTAVSLENFGT